METIISLASSGSQDSGKTQQAVAAAKQVQSYLKTTTNCGAVINFGYANNAVIGLYVGGNFQNGNAADTFVQKFIDHVQSNGIANTTLAQYCGPDSDYVLGIVANVKGDLAGVQRIVRSWSDSECVAGLEQQTKEWAKITLNVAASPILTDGKALDKSFKPADTSYKAKSNWNKFKLEARATCTYIKVVSGDSCKTLASKCKITGPKFTEYNTKANLCSTLAVGQPVCCNKGTLPDLRPKPVADGTCASVVVKAGDYCAKIAASNGLTVANLETFNKQTWGWTGCKNLLAGIKMCLSIGRPPMPAPLTNAICGPQVPGSKPPATGKPLASLNPCKLNACCNIWGQCGTTSDFCTISKSSTGAPGTSAPGKNGCVSNCGTDVIKATKPARFFSIAYYEAWSPKRACLKMPVDLIDVKKYTHIHYAFAEVTADFKVDISGVQGEWFRFKSIKGPKKILSFGGWSFSTEQDSYPIFRQAVTDANRQKFANNVVAFLKQHNLDGIDFDWEYPGAPDIPGIPPGGKNDGTNYLKFLKMVRAALPAGKSLSIAVPASFWYLQGFHPLKDYAPVLDYVIYMTYDLHGQWDYANKWASPGCPAGNCLRSHINSTETVNSLSMITKAGIPSNKVIVGVSSYGRSFKMAKAGCTGPQCTYVGPKSKAMPGRCTKTSGYIANAEIDEILRTNPSAKKLYDTASSSDIVVWNSTEWVAYMNDKTKAARAGLYKDSFNMGGVTDWAVDLQAFVTRPPLPPLPPYPACDSHYLSLEDVVRDVSKIPKECLNIYLVQAQSESLKRVIGSYQDILRNGYDDQFYTYEKYLRMSVLPEFDRWIWKNREEYFTCIHPWDPDHPISCPDSFPTLNDWNVQDSIKWILKDKDHFFNDISEKAGIDPSWIHFEDRVSDRPPPGPCTPNCATYWFDYPTLNDPITIPNPKKAIEAALTNLEDLSYTLDGAAEMATIFGDDGEMLDAITASELPVFMTETAIESMRKIVDLAGDIQDADRKQFILSFITGFLFIVPAVGGIAEGLGLVVIGKILQVVGGLGELAFVVRGIVEDPDSAVVTILGLLIGAGGGTRGGIKKAADIRRGMS
ncbi:Endochitinase [Dactylellina cionopaga]|nr:Endochitinase [Dactylellina cionopaga]